MKFRSKVDGWIGAMFLASFVYIIGFSIYFNLQPVGSGTLVLVDTVMLGIFALLLWILRSTRYEIHQGHLKISSGPFRWSVDLVSIRAVKPTRSPLSSPALSLDRLHIDYEGSKFGIMISPQDKAGFLREMAKRCPNAAIGL